MSQDTDLIARIRGFTDVVNAFKSEAVQLRVLEALLGVPVEAPLPPPAPSGRTAVRTKAPKAKASAGNATPVKSSRRGSGNSAYGIIMKLAGEGFFRSPQTIGSITKHASEKLGHHLKANECSPSLLRLLRQGRLKRSKNADHQYEYVNAN